VPRGLVDPLGVNELHAGLCRSLVQLASPSWSDEVGVGRQGCCTSLLYLYAWLSKMVSSMLSEIVKLSGVASGEQGAS
jgi:hypothetical protein